MFPAEVGAYLAGAGIGLTVGTNLWYVPIPDSAADPAVGLIESVGEADAGTFGGSLTASAFQRPRMLVVVRGAREAAVTARTLAKSVYDKLHRLGPVTLSGVTYYDVRADQQPYGPDYDKNERPVYRFTISATKDPS